jgi:hypothetical protein
MGEAAARSPQGLRFYLGMSDVVRRCRQEADDLVFTRRMQREELRVVSQRPLAAPAFPCLAAPCTNLIVCCAVGPLATGN